MKKLEGKIVFSSNSAISLISLVITIICIILLAMISLWNNASIFKETAKTTFYSDISQIQTLVQVKRKENMQYRNKDYGFEKIKIINAPNDFKSVSTEGMMGYIVDLEYVGANGSRTGLAYKTLNPQTGEVIFGKTDVYVYDYTGKVYYAKGAFTEDDTLYQISGDTTFEGPVIKSAIYMLHADKSKAMISIEAYSQDGTLLTIQVGGETAGYQDNNSYYVEKTQNGTYEIVAKDIYGNKTTKKLVVSGIVQAGETDESPSTAAEILTLTAGEQIRRKVTITATAIDSDDGISAYAFSYGTTMPAFGWSDANGTKSKVEASFIADQTGPYCFWVKNTDNVVVSSTVYIEINSKEYVVEYHLNDGNWADGISRDQSKEDDDLVYLTTDTPVKLGYTFIGWAVTSEGTSVVYNPGDPYSDEDDLDLYAIWVANTDTPYKVEHYKENIDGSYSLAETENLQGTTDTTATATVKTYEHFYQNASHIQTLEKGNIAPNGSLTLKLYYTRYTYEVSLDSIAGTISGAGRYKYGATVNITAEPNRGYEFSKWDVKSGTISDLDPNKANASFVMPGENVSLTAVCEIIEYAITYDLDGGNVNPSNPTKYTVKEVFTLNNPVKDGYRFSGWSGTDITDISKEVTIANAIGARSYKANYNELFTLEVVNKAPTYNDVEVRITSLDNVNYQYSIDGGNTWKATNTLVLAANNYIGSIIVSENVVLKVRALKADNSVEDVKEIEVSNILTESKANRPVLESDMVAVYWEGNTQKEASKFTDEMYSYTTGDNELTNTSSRWANAKTDDGSYWVWIPKFAYKVVYYTDETRTVVSDTQTDYEKIFVVFMYGDSDTKYLDNETGNVLTLSEGYKIPKAFNYNDINLTGIWVAKYEAATENTTSSLGGGDILTTNAGNPDTISVVSKPNLKSWRGISYDNAYNNSINMFDSKNPNLITNAEWEAVAILTHSEYGVNTAKLTNGENYLTGTGSSTTGNITGIYDFSGNAWEYVQEDDEESGIKMLEYLDYVMVNNPGVADIIGKTVRGSSAASDVINFPVDGGADSRIGYRMTLHMQAK